MFQVSLIARSCHPRTVFQVIYTIKLASFPLFGYCSGACCMHFSRVAAGRSWSDGLRRHHSVIVKKLYNLGVECCYLIVLFLELLGELPPVTIIPLDILLEQSDFVSVLPNFSLESRVDIFKLYYAELQSRNFAILILGVVRWILHSMIEIGPDVMV